MACRLPYMARDPHLQELLTDQDAVDTERVVAALKGKVGIDSTSGALVLDTGFDDLSAEGKVLCTLLGRLAAVLLDLQQEEAMAPKEVIQASGVPGGTVHPTLKRLREKRLVAQDETKRYFVPRNKILPVVEVIGSDDE